MDQQEFDRRHREAVAEASATGLPQTFKGDAAAWAAFPAGGLECLSGGHYELGDCLKPVTDANAIGWFEPAKPEDFAQEAGQEGQEGVEPPGDQKVEPAQEEVPFRGEARSA